MMGLEKVMDATVERVARYASLPPLAAQAVCPTGRMRRVVVGTRAVQQVLTVTVQQVLVV